MPGMDPVLFEVLKHKIWALVDEQAISLRAASGSPVVTESNDFNVGLYLPDGTAVALGRYILTQAFTTGSIIKSIVADYVENPGWGPGDMFVCNDPFRGSLHGQDVSVVMPLYHEGRHVAWAGCCAHQMDMGGMTFGSWCPQATERQQESMVITPLRLVEGGRLRKDLWDMLLAGSRLPVPLALDLKAMMSSNRLAQQRYLALAGRYGGAAVEEALRELVELTASRLRRRLRELPDAVVTSTDYIEHDGHADRLYRIRLRLEKQADHLDLDFSGTSPQAPGFINCSFSGLIAGIAAGMSPLLAFDLPYNEGLLRVVRVHAPEGCLVNAISPAPTSMASVSSVHAVTAVVVSALSQLLAASPAYRTESCARTRGAITIINVSGQSRNGERFGTMLLDSLGGGGGAWPDRDGLHTCGTFWIPEPNIANVESTESVAPLLFLYRKLLPDSGGAGAHRGGQSLGFAFTPHRAERMEAVLISHGVGVPNATGLFGGFPGSYAANRLCRGSDLFARFAGGRVPSGLEELAGEVLDLGPKPGRMALVPGDVLACEVQGGGGYGDPFDRDPGAVAADVTAGAVSLEAARRLYGVALADGRVDAARTAALRAGRLRAAAGQGPRGAAPLGHGLFLGRGRVLCACGTDLGEAGEDWKLVPAEIPADWSRTAALRPELALVVRACPACGRFHAVCLAEAGCGPEDGLRLSGPGAQGG